MARTKTEKIRRRRRIDGLAVVAGAIRLASGVSFLVTPEAANRLWGDEEEPEATASLLLRSMGYRDALIGGLLIWSGVRPGGSSAGWFLASAGADAADLAGGLANHDRMTPSQQMRGLGGAAVGIAVGLFGAARAVLRPRACPPPFSFWRGLAAIYAAKPRQKVDQSSGSW